MTNPSGSIGDAARQSLKKSTELVETARLYEQSGQAGMMQAKTNYSTAVHVIKERDLQQVERRCLMEAAIAGEQFYYSWSQGGSMIEGLSVGAAMSIVRNFGNCAVVCEVTETPQSYIFNGVFVDLETGFNLSRPFRQRKESPKKKDGSDVYSGDRGEDVIFQIGASKAIRNAVLNAVPKWLSDKVIEKAKENVTGLIAKMGIEKAKEMVTKKALALGIDLGRVEAIYGKQGSWPIEKVVMISSALRAIEDGVESADELFPKPVGEGSQEPETKEPPKKEKAEKKPPEGQPANEFTFLSTAISTAKAKGSLVTLSKRMTESKNSGLLTPEQFNTLTSKLDERENALAAEKPTK